MSEEEKEAIKVLKDLVGLGYEEDNVVNYIYSLDWNSRIEDIIKKINSASDKKGSEPAKKGRKKAS